jgi:hypothetical protein
MVHLERLLPARSVVRDGRLTGRLLRRRAVEEKASAIDLSINAR